MGTGEYALKLIKGQQPLTITLKNPIEGSSIPQGNVTLSAEATDVESSVRQVQFWYHDGNWETGKWVDLGTDDDGTDGWNAILDTTSLPAGEIISVYAIAENASGSWNYDAAWKVRISEQPLTLNLAQLPNPSQTTALDLSWHLSGAGAETAPLTVEHKINGGAWNNLLTNTRQTQYWYIGEAGNSYAFRVSAHDHAGNEVIQQTDTSIPSASTLCSQPDEWDVSASENDNAPATATEIAVGQAAQRHNFCNPTAGDFLGDEDWLSFTAETGQLYVLTAKPGSNSGAAVTIRLYAANGTTLLAEAEAANFERRSEIFWTASEGGTFYVQLLHNNRNVAGNGVSYTVQLTNGAVYLPLIKK
jgi:hypothetical protein